MLCNFATAFPEFVGDLLDREEDLTRNFREETITDMWVASLVPLKGYGVFIDLAVERETGADIELWFLSEGLDSGVGFVIQAKRCTCRRKSKNVSSGKICNWKKHRFEELDHASGEGKRKGTQARDLVRSLH